MRVAGGARAAYRIEDEPLPSGVAHLAVHPLWPLLGVMLGGAWLAWPWFVLNGFALGSPTRRRELAWAAAGFAGTALLLVVLGVAIDRGLLAGLPLRYALVSIALCKLAVSYRLYMLQGRCFEIFIHFGGTVRSGLAVVALSWFVERRLFGDLPDFWILLLG